MKLPYFLKYWRFLLAFNGWKLSGLLIYELYLNYFLPSKMAISEYKNGHFEEIGAWLQILQMAGNSTLFYLSFDTHDSPGAVFIWKFLALISLCKIVQNCLLFVMPSGASCRWCILGISTQIVIDGFPGFFAHTAIVAPGLCYFFEE